MRSNPYNIMIFYHRGRSPLLTVMFLRGIRRIESDGRLLHVWHHDESSSGVTSFDLPKVREIRKEE